MAVDLGYPRPTKVVVFDIDGTLYSQACLRTKVAFDLLGYCARFPYRLGDVRLISAYRKFREIHPAPEKGQDFVDFHYLLVAEKYARSVDDVQEVIENWIHNRPLKFLKSCMYAGVRDTLDWLKHHDVKVAVFSDYPAADKLAAMGIDVDIVVSAYDDDVRRLKPDPAGLEKVVQQLGCTAGECVYIGDREDRDGLCAKALDMPFILVRKTRFDKVSSKFYASLMNQWETRLL